MRRDMFEVIIERPRGGAGWQKKSRREERTERAFERAPKREGMSPGRGTKWLNENLAPLGRFLRARTGKPWSRVSSEMRAVLSMRSAVQKHVMDHVRQYVEENVVFVDGKPHRPHCIDGRLWPLNSHPRWPRFYVCPRTGLLREAPPRERRRRTA